MEKTVLLIYLITIGIRYGLRGLNLRHLKKYGDSVPAAFSGVIDSARLEKTVAYTVARSRIGLIESLLGDLLLVLFLFGGLLGLFDRWVASFADSFMVGGLAFFLLLQLAATFLEAPFGLYRTFVIERRFGFNTMRPGLWLADFLKTTLLSLALLALLLAGGLSLVRLRPGDWWLWVWAFFALASLFLIYLSPRLIEPLFQKFEPVRSEDLEARVREMMEKAGLRVGRVLQVDASRRSRHSNAYFTGIGRVKRIVLFDTLLEQMSQRQILAILAHEVGHWKKGHLWKKLLLTETLSLAALYLAYRLLDWQDLPLLVGEQGLSLFARLVIVGFLASLAAVFLTPLFNWLSRRDERAADRFACDLCEDLRALADGLIKLAGENLANLHPHPLYAFFYYSHPPLVDRVQCLLEASMSAESSDRPESPSSGF